MNATECVRRLKWVDDLLHRGHITPNEARRYRRYIQERLDRVKQLLEDSDVGQDEVLMELIWVKARPMPFINVGSDEIVCLN